MLSRVIIIKQHKSRKILIKCSFIIKIKPFLIISLFNKIILKKVIWVFKWLLLEIRFHLIIMKILLKKG